MNKIQRLQHNQFPICSELQMYQVGVMHKFCQWMGSQVAWNWSGLDTGSFMCDWIAIQAFVLLLVMFITKCLDVRHWKLPSYIFLFTCNQETTNLNYNLVLLLVSIKLCNQVLII